MIYGYARVSARTQLNWVIPERKNAEYAFLHRVSDYIMGHNGNPLDLRYVKDYYPLAKKALPAWEKVLDEIIGTKTK